MRSGSNWRLANFTWALLVLSFAQTIGICAPPTSKTPAGDPLPDGATFMFGGLGTALHGIDRADVSPDGKLLATNSASGMLRLWELGTGKLVRSYDCGGHILDLRWRSDGKLAVISEVSDGTFLMRLIVPEQEDSSMAAVIAREREAAARRKSEELFDHFGVMLSADARRAIAIMHVGAGYGTRRADVYRFEDRRSSATVEPEKRIPLPAIPRYCSLTKDGDTLLAAVESGQARHGHRLHAFYLDGKCDGTPDWTLELGDSPNHRPHECTSVEGRRVVIAFWDKAVELWDGPGGKKIRDLPALPLDHSDARGYANGCGIDLTADGARIALVGRNSGGEVGGRIVDVDTGEEVRPLAAGPMPHTAGAARFAAKERYLIRVGDGAVRVWDARTGARLAPLPEHHGRIRELVFSWDGRTMITSGDDLTLRGWDPAKGTELWRIAFPRSVQIRCSTPDGLIAHRSTHDFFTATWLVDVSTGKASPLPGPLGEAMSEEAAEKEKRVQRDRVLTISPDGKAVITINESSRAFRVWDWPTGALRATVPLEPPPKRASYRGCVNAQYTPDGRQLLAAMAYGDVQSGLWVERWDLSASKMLARSVDAARVQSLFPGLSGPLTIGREQIVRDPVVDRDLVRLVSEHDHRMYASPRRGATAQSPDGRVLVVAEQSSPAAVRVFESATGRLRQSLLYGIRGPDQAQFLADGRLVTAGETMLIWDLRLRAAADASDNLAGLWSALAEFDPVKARPAMEKMAGAGAKAVEFMQSRIRPVARLDDKELDQLIKDLDAPNFRDRETASAKLDQLGRVAVPGIRNRLARSLTAEARMRAERFLAKHDRIEPMPAEVQSLRASEVLEAVGTPEAAELLGRLAAGEPTARLTQDSAGAFRRLRGR
jgi:WD40 repeat protein